MDSAVRCAESHLLWRKKLLKFTGPTGNSTYRIRDPLDLKFFVRLVVSFSRLRQLKFSNNFAGILNLLYGCSLKTECSELFFLRCDNYVTFRTFSMNKLRDMDISLVLCSCSDLPKVILHGNERFNSCRNKKILTATTKYIENIQRFNHYLFWTYKNYPFHI